MPFPDTTGNRTYLELVDGIRDHLGKANNTTVKTQIQMIVKNALRELNRHTWNFNRTVQDVTLTALTNTYVLTDVAIRKMVLARYLNAGEFTENTVEYVEWTRLNERIQDLTATGRPVLYSFRNLYVDGSIFFYPTPTVAENTDTVRLDFFKRVAVPAADGTAWAVPEWFEGCIFWTALAEAHLMLTHDIQRATWAAAKAKDEFRQAKWQDGLDSTQGGFGMTIDIKPPIAINNTSMRDDWLG